MAGFDFDHWCDLAKRDPAAFFHARHRLIERFIESHPAPQARRLREMQAFIDCVRVSSGTPMGAVRNIAGLMQERLDVLRRKGAELNAAGERLKEMMHRLEEHI
ncbi:DUF3135 domain-containing protein [Azoarcus olearius]|uniref:DUF3135 domain-containing protein n=1 Tax=Azoarcus sp. (strain BH72) TaxID=418699 RepID=A1K5H5_AZOSB|nr:DUF3135 domain-containing protein [Azoarcus olearius]ANQ84630.1 hypothetical protein dqs_1586 [Azoarcus olearius]CAL94080.1 Hypothetical protein azo1463 [Azoarcus olearius]